MSITHDADERPPSGLCAAPPRSDGEAAAAALLYGYKLEQRHDVPNALDFVLENFGATIIVALHASTAAIKARYLDRSNLARIIPWAENLNGDGFNLYFHVNEPRAGLNTKAKKEDIINIRAAAYADMDAKDGRSHGDVIAAIKALPQPSHVIFSGGGYQPFWLLSNPVPISVDVIARAEALGERLAALAGGDAVQNVDRILRLPFSVNYPNQKKREHGRQVCLSGLLMPENQR